jgi:hypothetical protein
MIIIIIIIIVQVLFFCSQDTDVRFRTRSFHALTNDFELAYLAVIIFADDEWIYCVSMPKSYGPYGNPTSSETVTINGTITGFYGENERINALGFYF